MVLAMNLYDIREGKQEVYEQYMIQSMALMDGIDVEVLATGHNPRKMIKGKTRQHFGIIKFGSLEDFETLMQRQIDANFDQLREDATENYIWTIYDEWDLNSLLSSD